MSSFRISAFRGLTGLCHSHSFIAILIVWMAATGDCVSQDLIEQVRNSVGVLHSEKTSALKSQDIIRPFDLSNKKEKIGFKTINDNDVVLLKYYPDAFKNSKGSIKRKVLVEVPVSGKSSFIVSLEEVNVLSPSYGINGTKKSMNSKRLIRTYRGEVLGSDESLVTLTLSDNYFRMLISDLHGDYNMGLLPGSTNLIALYNDKHLLDARESNCLADELVSPLDFQSIDNNTTYNKGNSNSCISIFLETDRTTYNQGFNGDIEALENYMIGIFAEVASIYAMEGISISLSQIRVSTSAEEDWSIQANTAQEALDLFAKERKNNFPGTLAHFMTMRNFGGGLGWTDVACAAYTEIQADWDGDGTPEQHHYGPYALSSFMSGESTELPMYSWDVAVMAHEIGHNLGSPHTHACAWGPNSLAIDDCHAAEGNCSLIESPTPSSEKGTVMSYCGAGDIDLMKGFGALPGDLLRSKISSSTCELSCDPTLGCMDPNYYEYNPKVSQDDGTCSTSCGDGIKNGNETGIDCGGSLCESCIDVCSDNYIRLILKVDNFPTEISWTLRDSISGDLIDQNSDYQSLKKDDEIVLEYCLPDGVYVFDIQDQYGDGICCGQGEGSYSFYDREGKLLRQSGDYGPGETYSFHLTSSTCSSLLMVSESPSFGLFTARDKVVTEGRVMVDSSASFIAPSIQIEAGFAVMKGAIFEVENNGCH